MSAKPAETTYARRLNALLSYLDLTPTEFAIKAELSEGYVSKILSGHLGKGGELPKLHHKAESLLGIDGHYWTARVDITPEKAHRKGFQQGGHYMGRMIGAQSFGEGTDVRKALADIAAERDEDPRVVKELLRTQAPPNADDLWWFKRYLDLKDQYAAKSA